MTIFEYLKINLKIKPFCSSIIIILVFFLFYLFLSYVTILIICWIISYGLVINKDIFKKW